MRSAYVNVYTTSTKSYGMAYVIIHFKYKRKLTRLHFEALLGLGRVKAKSPEWCLLFPFSSVCEKLHLCQFFPASILHLTVMEGNASCTLTGEKTGSQHFILSL